MKSIAIIPCFNEAENIHNVVKETHSFVDEVIVVDDGSRDSTSAQASNADFVLRHEINLGKGAAMKTGVEAAKMRNADILIFIDGDGQHSPSDIPRFLSTLDQRACDIVVGMRKFNRNMPFLFKVGNHSLNALFTLLFGLKVEDTQSGFRAIRSSVINSILWSSNGYAVETEMLANAGKNGLRCVEIPIETKYLDTVKGTTVIDGIKIGASMVRWRLGW